MSVDTTERMPADLAAVAETARKEWLAV